MTKLKEQKEKAEENNQLAKQRRLERQAEQLMRNPCFVLAHELYDALPIHQFHFNEKR